MSTEFYLTNRKPMQFELNDSYKVQYKPTSYISIQHKICLVELITNIFDMAYSVLILTDYR